MRGGVDVVQLRDKELSDDELVAAAEPFRAACEEHGALFVLNDRPDLVEACGARRRPRRAERHAGRRGEGARRARPAASGSPSRPRTSSRDVGGADYVGVTAFATPTKEDAVAGGLELLRLSAETLTVPWFAIGGVDLSNVAEVTAAGAPGVAVVRAIRDAADPEAAARELRAALDR